MDHVFGQAEQHKWNFNSVTVDDPRVVYAFQTTAFKKIRMRATSSYRKVRIDPEVTVLQLVSPPPDAEVIPVGDQCMGLLLSSDWR